MSVRTRLRGALKALTEMRHDTRGSSFMEVLLPGTAIDYATKVGDGSRSSVVAAPIGWIHRNAPDVEITVSDVRRGERVDDDEHALAQLWREPNRHYSGAVLMSAIAVSQVTTGNAYVLVVRAKSGRPEQLWWAPSHLISPKWPKDGSELISHFEYRPTGASRIRVEAEDVIHFRGQLDPRNVRMGTSQLKSLYREVATDDEAAGYAAALVANSGVPGLIVTPKGEVAISDDELKATKERLRAMSGDKRGEPAVFRGEVGIHKVSLDPSEMDLSALRRIPEERVCAVLGIHPAVVGIGAGLDRSTYSNMEEARRGAYREALIPLWKSISDELQRSLLPEFDTSKTARVRFAIERVSALQEDANAKSDRLRADLKAGAITRAQFLAATGRTPAPHDDVFLLPLTVQEIPAGSDLAQPRAIEKSADSLFGAVGAGERIAAGRVANRTAEVRAAIPNRNQLLLLATDEDPLVGVFPEAKDFVNRRPAGAEDWQVALIEALASDVDALGGSGAAKIASAFDELGHMAEAEFRRLSGLKTDEDTAALVLAGLRLAEWTSEEFGPLLGVLHTSAAETTVGTLQTHVGVGVNLPDHRMREIVATGGKRVGLIDIEGGTRSAIFSALETAREEGLGPDAAARRIREWVPAGRYQAAGAAYRAKLIARTETKWAQNVSAMEAYRAAPGIDSVLAFDAQGPGETDADCIARNGQTFSLDDAERAMAAEHPNGTLSFAPTSQLIEGLE